MPRQPLLLSCRNPVREFGIQGQFPAGGLIPAPHWQWQHCTGCRLGNALVSHATTKPGLPARDSRTAPEIDEHQGYVYRLPSRSMLATARGGDSAPSVPGWRRVPLLRWRFVSPVTPSIFRWRFVSPVTPSIERLPFTSGYHLRHPSHQGTVQHDLGTTTLEGAWAHQLATHDT